jgi:DNA-binding transcriptional ArsR family regulator
MTEKTEGAATGAGKVGDAELLVALRHEMRRKILRTMDEEDPVSPRRLAEVLHEPLSNVSYHVRVLDDCGAVELVDTAEVRGSMQHFYSSRVEEPWALAVLGLQGEAEPSADGGADDDRGEPAR